MLVSAVDRCEPNVIVWSLLPFIDSVVYPGVLLELEDGTEKVAGMCFAYACSLIDGGGMGGTPAHNCYYHIAISCIHDWQLTNKPDRCNVVINDLQLILRKG